MDVFDLRRRLVEDYKSYTRSFIKIRGKSLAYIVPIVDRVLRTGPGAASRRSSFIR
jgi:hypothetical protein